MQNETNGIAHQMAAAPNRNNRRPRQQEAPTTPTVETTGSASVAETFAADTDTDTETEPTPSRIARRSMLEYLLSTHPLDSITFKMNVRDPGTPWSDGTVSQSIADVVISTYDPLTNLDMGLEVRGSRIVKKTKGGKAVLDLQLPSTGQKFRSPVFDSDEQSVKDGINRWRKAVADHFKVWRLAQVEIAKSQGRDAAAAVNISNSAVEADAEMLKELGI